MKRVIIKYDAGYNLSADASILWQPKSVAIDMLDNIAENVVEKQGKSRYIEGPYHNGRGSCPVMEIIERLAFLQGYGHAVFREAELI